MKEQEARKKAMELAELIPIPIIDEKIGLVDLQATMPLINQYADHLFDALLESRKKALEEAAKVAESHAWDYSTYPSRVGLVQGIAQAIRELSGSTSRSLRNREKEK